MVSKNLTTAEQRLSEAKAIKALLPTASSLNEVKEILSRLVDLELAALSASDYDLDACYPSSR